MIKDFVVIDDVLDDPLELVHFAKIISYYSKEKEPIDGIRLRDDLDNPEILDSRWRGFHSDYLHNMNNGIFSKVFKNVCEKILLPFENNISYRYNVKSHLHYSPGSIEYSERWWHTDPNTIFAGVIYLNETPEKNSGTIVKLNDQEIVFENVFNRLVLYRANLVHRPQGCFGDNIDNCRLVLPMFFKEFCLKV